MKKTSFLLYLTIAIPILLIIFVGVMTYTNKTEISNYQTASGIIEKFEKGSNGRRKYPMYIVIDKEKYNIVGGTRYAYKTEELQNIFKEGNEVEINFITGGTINQIIGFHISDEINFTIEEYIEYTNIQNKTYGITFINIGYSFLIYMIFFFIYFNNLSPIFNKIYLSKKNFVFTIIISIITFIISIILSIALSGWIYPLLITISVTVSYLMISSVSNINIYNELILFIKRKKIIYQWNGVKEIYVKEKRNSKTIIINFTKQLYTKELHINKYINIDNKYIIKFNLSNKNYKSFIELCDRYYKKEIKYFS